MIDDTSAGNTADERDLEEMPRGRQAKPKPQKKKPAGMGRKINETSGGSGSDGEADKVFKIQKDMSL